MTVNASKGFNYQSYDFTSDKKKELEVAENGKYYLPAGKYVLKVSGNGASTEREFEVEKPRQRPKRKGSK